MTPFICRVKDDPPKSYGDCLRACVTSMLDNEHAPHFTHDGCDFETSIMRLREWLKKEHGFKLMLSYYPSNQPYKLILDFMGARNPNIEYLLFSHGHVVVCRDDKIIHDPAWYRTELRVPEEAWVVGIFTI